MSLDSLININQSIYLGLVFFTSIFFLWVGWKGHSLWKVFLFWWQRRHGKKGEIKAKKLLRQCGYKIIDSQITFPGCIHIDDKPVDFYIRPDYIVERNNIQYLAEVKTGKSAFPTNRMTRRQMSEYATLTKTNTIILVDSTKGRVMKIRFS